MSKIGTTEKDIALVRKSENLIQLEAVTVHKLYKGSVTILHHPNGKPRYRISGKKNHPLSVSQIAQTSDKSATLLPWSNRVIKKTFEEYYGRCSGTTFTKTEIMDIVYKALEQPELYKTDAGKIGTLVHDWLSEFAKAKIEKNKIPDLPSDKKAQKCISGFLKWYNTQKKVEFLETERVVYSKKYNYVGRLDTVARVNGVVMLWDYKTSNGLYPSCFLQMAGYYKARNEEKGKEWIKKGILFHLDKENWTFKEPIIINNLDEYFKGFRHALNLRREEKKILKQLQGKI